MTVWAALVYRPNQPKRWKKYFRYQTIELQLHTKQIEVPSNQSKNYSLYLFHETMKWIFIKPLEIHSEIKLIFIHSQPYDLLMHHL